MDCSSTMQTMLVRVDPDSAVGLADQIASQVRGAVAAGRLEPGAKLPPARELAAGLEVNMHTVLRAYSTLRDEGLIDLRRGRGAQIRADIDVGMTQLDQEINALVQSAARIGMTQRQLIDHMEEVLE